MAAAAAGDAPRAQLAGEVSSIVYRPRGVARGVAVLAGERFHSRQFFDSGGHFYKMYDICGKMQIRTYSSTIIDVDQSKVGKHSFIY